MHKLLKTASVELAKTPNDRIVKVASIISRLKAWYNSLMDPSYRSRISKLQTESAGLKVDLDRVQRYMEEVNKSIKNGDLDKYNYSLNSLKEAVSSLSNYFSAISADIDAAQAPPEAREPDKSVNKVVFRPTTLEKIKPQIISAFKSAGIDDQTISEIFADQYFLSDIENALMNNSEIIGSSVAVSKGKNENRIGEVYVTYKTKQFPLSNFPILLSIQAVLTDLSGRADRPMPIMAVTRISKITANKITTANINDCFDCSIQKNALVRPLKGNEVTPDIKNQAEIVLRNLYGKPYGSEEKFEIEGKQYVGRLEQHYHEPGGSKKPYGNHPGITVYALEQDSLFSSENPFSSNPNWSWAFDMPKIKSQIGKYNLGNKIRPEKTQISRDDFTNACKRVWGKVFGEDSQPNEEILGMLWAQAALETGHFRSMYNYNFGNIKASPGWSQNNKFTGFNCGENLKDNNGNVRSVNFTGNHPVCFFRAYDTLDEGLINFLGTLKKSYGTALNKAFVGDTRGFVKELKNKGYFTGNAQTYSNAVTSLYNQYREGKPEVSPQKASETPKLDKSDDWLSGFLQELQGYLKAFAEMPASNLIKQALASELLPKNNIIITIYSIDKKQINKYASVLSDCLENTIDAEVIASDNKIICSAVGPEESLIMAIEAIDNVVSRAFWRNCGGLAYGEVENAIR